MLRTGSPGGRKGGKGVVFADDKPQIQTFEDDQTWPPSRGGNSDLKVSSPPPSVKSHEATSSPPKRTLGRNRTPQTPEQIAKSRASSSRQLLSRLRSERLLGGEAKAATSSGVFSFSGITTQKRSSEAHKIGTVDVVDVRSESRRPTSSAFQEFVFSNGDKYEGSWMCGMLTGEGQYTKKGGRESYSGTWVNDTLEGFGEHKEPSGRTYAGNFKEGVRCGRGRLKLPLQNMDAAGKDKNKQDEDERNPAGRTKAGSRLGPRPPAGTGTVGGAGEGFECEWRNGKMVGKVSRVWYRMYNDKTGLPMEGEEGRATEGYVNTLNQPTGPILRPEADRRYDVSAGGRRYEFAVDRGGFNPLLDPPFRPHTPRTAAMLSKHASVYKDPSMQGWGDAKTLRDDGDEVYEGEEKMCLDGIKRRYGKGTARWGPGGRDMYSGEWLYNQKHGKGERIWANGEVYNGTWTHGRMHGKGSYRWKGGAKYNGEFVKGRRSGKGVQVWPAEGRGGVMEYDGDWKNDKREGRGRLSYPDGREYFGEWVAGRMMGTGKMVYANGWTYEGDFHADMKHGQGIRTEWYDARHGRRFAVRYQYNVLQSKKDIGPVTRGSSGASDVEGREGGLDRSALIANTSSLHLDSSSLLLSPPRRHAHEAADGALASPTAQRSPGPTSRSAGGLASPAPRRAAATDAADEGRMGESAGEASGRHIVPQLHLQRATEQGNLPLSPPRSPPFSPTDNNQDKTFEEDAMRYPAGNWTYGERKEREDDEALGSTAQSSW